MQANFSTRNEMIDIEVERFWSNLNTISIGWNQDLSSQNKTIHFRHSHGSHCTVFQRIHK